MNNFLVTFAFLLVFLNMPGQGNVLQLKYKKEQILEIEKGVLLIALKNTSTAGGLMSSVKRSPDEALDEEVNRARIDAFQNHYTFSTVFYYHEADEKQIMQGDFAHHIRDNLHREIDPQDLAKEVIFMGQFLKGKQELPSETWAVSDKNKNEDTLPEPALKIYEENDNEEGILLVRRLTPYKHGGHKQSYFFHFQYQVGLHRELSTFAKYKQAAAQLDFTLREINKTFFQEP